VTNTDDNQILLGVPKELAVEFFLEFSRLEYAMKACRFLKNTTPGARAEASWELLANRLGQDFLSGVRDTGVAPRLIQQPPKDLRVTQDGVQFGEQPPPPDSTTDLLRYMWRVRNNLFHGSKMVGVPSTRNAELMEDVRRLIGTILQEVQELGNSYNDLPPA
jgi:hypothetical protein